ncbi:MAG TPA: 2-hydroxymuconate tautomerase [Dehalococcoidales bacterium]|nr:2-hydroxymuconate tautomerase [Dehalococcoidales bacterium]
MPVVTVNMLEGRTEEQKRTLVEGITAVFEKIGVPPEALNIVIIDIPKHNWGYKGKLLSGK